MRAVQHSAAQRAEATRQHSDAANSPEGRGTRLFTARMRDDASGCAPPLAIRLRVPRTLARLSSIDPRILTCPISPRRALSTWRIDRPIRCTALHSHHCALFTPRSSIFPAL